MYFISEVSGTNAKDCATYSEKRFILNIDSWVSDSYGHLSSPSFSSLHFTGLSLIAHPEEWQEAHDCQTGSHWLGNLVGGFYSEVLLSYSRNNEVGIVNMLYNTIS